MYPFFSPRSTIEISLLFMAAILSFDFANLLLNSVRQLIY
nr:MAG TPA: hypothetical protein [Caudoviricetes sp.]